MSFRNSSPEDKLVHKLPYVLCMDDDFNRYENGAVAVVGDQIQAVGDMDELQKEFQAPGSDRL